MDREKLNNFLNKIAWIESQGGQYTNHKQIPTGIQKGDSAIGTYGLMPNTIDEVVERMQRDGDITPDVAKTQDFDFEEDLKDYIESHPDVEKKIASKLASHVLSKQPTEDAAAYSWLNGHNLAPSRITPDKLDNSDYVQKFRQLTNVMNANNPPDRAPAQALPVSDNSNLPDSNPTQPIVNVSMDSNQDTNANKVDDERLAKIKAMMGS